MSSAEKNTPLINTKSTNVCRSEFPRISHLAKLLTLQKEIIRKQKINERRRTVHELDIYVHSILLVGQGPQTSYKS